MSIIEPTKGSHSFKKRVLRPWKPVASSEGFAHQADIHHELLKKQLEISLQVKTTQEEEFQEQLSMIENNRSITIGGFFQPNSVLLSQSNTFQKMMSLLNELKGKKQAILEVTQQLAVTQAQEEAKQAEIQRQAEQAERRLAEEKALAALRQAQQASASAQQAEARAHAAEQAKSQWEQAAQDLQLSIVRYQSIEKTLNEKIEEHDQKWSTAQTQMDHMTQALQLEKSQAFDLTQKLAELHEKMEQTLFSQQHTEQKNETLEDELLSLKEHLEKLNPITRAERQLRQLFEAKLRETTLQVFHLEARLQCEESARKSAEEKSKKIIEKASAVIRVLESA